MRSIARCVPTKQSPNRRLDLLNRGVRNNVLKTPPEWGRWRKLSIGTPVESM